MRSDRAAAERRGQRGASTTTTHDLTGTLAGRQLRRTLLDTAASDTVIERDATLTWWWNELTRVALLRDVRWWPAIGHATTKAPTTTGSVEAVLRQVLSAVLADPRVYRQHCGWDRPQ